VIGLERERRFERGGGRSPGRPAVEAMLLLGATVVLTAGSWALREDGLPLRADPSFYELQLAAPLVTVEQALALYDAGDHLFVDVRPDDGGETVPGAFAVREASFDDDLLHVFDFMTRDDPLIVFGDGALTAASNVAGRLLDRGWTDVTIMQGGIAAWRAAGGPLSPRQETP